MDASNDFLDDTGDLSDPKTFNHTDASGGWQSVFSPNADQRVVIDLTTEANSFLLKFYGHPYSSISGATNGPLYVGQGAIWGVSKLDNSEYMGDYLGRFELVVGEDTVTSSTILSTNPDTAWVRQIGITEDRSIFPAMRVVGQEGDAAALLAFDSMGYSQIIVEMRSTLPAGFSRAGYDTASAPTDLGCLRRVL